MLFYLRKPQWDYNNGIVMETKNENYYRRKEYWKIHGTLTLIVRLTSANGFCDRDVQDTFFPMHFPQKMRGEDRVNFYLSQWYFLNLLLMIFFIIIAISFWDGWFLRHWSKYASLLRNVSALNKEDKRDKSELLNN